LYKDQQITDVFTPEQLKNSVHLEVYMLETSLFINDGTGHFTRKSLPAEVQFSPVYAADVNDYNGDGRPDVLLGGNLYNVKPEVGRYDASYGSLLLGDGSGEFSPVPPKKSGIRLVGEVRDIMEVTTPTGTILLIARSNEALQVLKVTGR
jgi:hypothetical protein